MGFRFSLQSANTVANLTFGKVMSCYRDIFQSWESYQQFLYFLDSFQENFYSGREKYYRYDVKQIREFLTKCYDDRYEDNFKDYESNNQNYYTEKYDERILDALKHLSKIFQRCKIKALLLSPDNAYNNDFMYSRRVLRNLARMHPGDSCLILQPEDCGESPTVFNAFPHFEVALRQADLWPAVLFWDDKDNYVFIPVSNEDELEELFRIIKYEDRPMSELKRYALQTKKPQRYLIQLSDLHIGPPKVSCGESRIRTLVQKHVNEINQIGSAKVIVTGDAVDSPLEVYEKGYDAFSDYMQLCCGQKPIRILGNHDINRRGIALSNRNKNLTSMVSGYPQITILEEEKIILLLFNSNTNGSLAQGKIGQTQMTKMGNELDKIKNLAQYKLIAVLHHHITQITRPDFFARKLFDRFIEKTLILKDADIFIQWLKQRNVKVVLHGHKHIPFYVEKDGISIIACGSSTGQVSMKEKGKTYISYNIIKLNQDGITCSQFVEDILGAGEQNIRTEVIHF